MTNASGWCARALGATLALGLVAVAPGAAAQDTGEARVRKLEAEVRALQRKVFPGGDPTTFAPEITRPADGTTSAPGQPATTPLTDVLARMDALEASLARVTAQVELQGNRIAQLEARAPAAAPTAAGPAPTDAVPADATPPQTDADAPPLAAPAANLQAMRGSPPAGRRPVDGQRVDGQRLAAVQAVERPQSGDPAEDAYSYGFRLWQAKLYPEAEQQLKLFLQQYPTHPRVSYGRNLLGRAYLDGGEPREAAKWLLQNYQADKTAPRAPDSLLYLGAAMKQLGDKTRACIALGEFASTYASDAAGRLKPDYEATRKGLTCS